MNSETSKRYLTWKDNVAFDDGLFDELEKISGDEKEIEDRFYRYLEFGTAGLRGVLGVGTNRMNVYTVGLATQSYAYYLKTLKDEPSVVIGFDSRINSFLFAKKAACVLAANGIKVHLFNRIMPIPLVSYAVRALKADGGIMITASHNPSKYNGYKVFASDGCQIGEEPAELIAGVMGMLDPFKDVLTADFERAMINRQIDYIIDNLISSYYDKVLFERLLPDLPKETDLKIVYTPLNGTGNEPCRTVLSKAGYKNVFVVPEQEMPNGRFPTCPFPNPEIKEALTLGLFYAEKRNADILIATDPDCDRVGIAVKSKDGFELLTGNEVGCLLLEYILKGLKMRNTFPRRPIAIKSIVSTPLADRIIESYGGEMRSVLTGFKYIGEEIGKLEREGLKFCFLLGFEESYGYLKGTHVRDKDGVVATLLIAEMAAYYKREGKTLADAKREMYERYGYYINRTENYYFEGIDGEEKISSIMDKLRIEELSEVVGAKLKKRVDYLKGVVEEDGVRKDVKLPRSNVICFEFDNGLTFIARPSGTEPKIKFYYTTTGKDEDEATVLYELTSEEIKKYLEI